MNLGQEHIEAFAKAEALLVPRDFKGYLDLKDLLPVTTPAGRSAFRALFINYYGLNTGGLSDAFKDRFFEILFGGSVIVAGKPDFVRILNELSSIPGRRGFCAMPFSFVSKLVGIHQEESPIYDRHVTAFFNVGAPSAARPKPQRISWYVNFISQVASDYSVWANDDRLLPILERFRARDSRLQSCHCNRLLDFLVWKVGNQKLLSS